MRCFHANMARTARSVSQMWAETLQMRATVYQPRTRAGQPEGTSSKRV